MILFLSFHEGCNDFLNVRDARGLLDLFEGIFNNTHITNILVHQLLLLFICGNHFVQPELQYNNWVAEITALVLVLCLLIGLIKVLVFEFDHLILHLQSVTQFLDLVLESLLLFLMLGSQGNNLIVSLLSYLLAENVLVILFLSLFLELSDVLAEVLDLVIGGGLLLTEKIDLASEFLVLCFGLVELDSLVVDIFGCGIELDVRLLLNKLRRFELLNRTVSLAQLLRDLLDLLLNDHESALLMLQLLCEGVDLLLESHLL